MHQFSKLEANMLTQLDRNAPKVGTEKVTSKRDKFVELAESRTKNAIKTIRVIAKLGNKNAYEFTEADVKKIVAALNREIEALRSRMMSSGGKETVDFKL
jgi:ribosomal protein L7/L12